MTFPCCGPCGPCNPCQTPCNPCGLPPIVKGGCCFPCNPCNPCAPTGCAPCFPCNPCAPCGPCGPYNSYGSYGSCNPYGYQKYGYESSSCSYGKKYKHKKSHKKCGDCPEYVYYLNTGCGCVSIKLDVSANPTTFTAAGEDITVTYTVTNCGNTLMCLPIQICDTKLGTTYIQNVSIQPGQTQTIGRTYTTSAADVTAGSINFCATAFACIGRTSWLVSCPASTTVTLSP